MPKKRRRYSKWGGVAGAGPAAAFVGLVRLVVGAAAVAAGLVILLAFTPLYFFIAKPLIQTDPPQKAQAIVVLSGGMNGDGSLASSTAERVGYGVELFKRGYAPLLIMSGGGPFRKVPDAKVMAEEAVRQGVNRQAIVTEDQSESTWENAVLTAKLLRDRGLNGILLVTSPYHSFRAKVMFRARGVAVASTPVQRSGFSAARGVQRLHYLKLMLLEYAKLVYYWLSRV